MQVRSPRQPRRNRVDARRAARLPGLCRPVVAGRPEIGMGPSRLGGRGWTAGKPRCRLTLQAPGLRKKLQPRPPVRNAVRSGFTLLEMTLVLVVLLIAAAVSWPAVQRAFDQQQLRQAAEVVQLRMMAARVHALDTGVMYQFRYEPGGRRFIAVPCEQDPAASGSIPEGTAVPRLSGKLPESVQFDAEIQTQQNLTHVADSDLAGLPDAEAYQGVNWGAPILFRPDGTATSAEIRLIDKEKQSLCLVVRPLTGGVTFSAENPKSPGGN